MQEKLLLLRKRHGYTQLQLAEKLNLTRQQYGLKERGAYPFDSDEMWILSELFDKKLDDIFLPRGHQCGDKEKKD